MHQPLHTIAMWSAQFPEGDRGGNLLIVRADGRMTNLHSFWDGLLGGYHSPRLIQRVADRAVEQHPRTELVAEVAVTDPILWARESEQLAREVAYLGGKLRGVIKAKADADRTLLIPDVPEGYAAAARELARKRIALAGIGWQIC